MANTGFIRLPFEGITNCRDLGGYATTDNKITKWKTVLRSSKMSNMTTADIDLLHDYGVRTIIDLRMNSEITKQPNPLAEERRFNYKNISLLGSEKNNSLASQIDTMDISDDLILGKHYITMLKRYELIKEIMDDIHSSLTDANKTTDLKGAVVFHCTAGKDRTGIIAMLLLGLVGVSKADIISNYQVSYTYILPEVTEFPIEYPGNILGSDPRNISLVYDALIEKFDTFENYYKEIGFNNEEIENLKSALIS